ncbi:LysR family transcriptional regulator, partial [Mesorhizobium sp. M2A.F.Ca.ET.040.01.1.1]
AEAMLRPAERLDLARLNRSFTLRNSDGFVENFGPALLARASREAPGVQLRFVPKPDKDSGPMREGEVDLETGVIGTTTGPEVRSRALFRDRFVGVARAGHELSEGRVTAARFAAGRHILISRRGLDCGPVDDALELAGLTRTIATVVGGFAEALALARGSDLIATVPERYTGTLREGLFTFSLPVKLAPLTISLLWHPRLDADPAHRWLRGLVKEVCGGARNPGP